MIEYHRSPKSSKQTWQEQESFQRSLFYYPLFIVNFPVIPVRVNYIADGPIIDLVPTGTFDDLYLHFAQRRVAASGPIWDYGPMFETVAL